MGLALVLLQLASAAAPDLSQIRLEKGSVVMIKQLAKSMGHTNDVFVTIHCPAPYDSCQTVTVQEAKSNLPKKK